MNASISSYVTLLENRYKSLSNITAFRSLPPSQLNDLSQALTYTTYNYEDAIVNFNDKLTSVIFVTEGEVVITAIVEDPTNVNKRIHVDVGVCGANEIIGDIEFCESRTNWGITLKAAGEVVTCELKLDDFQQFVWDNPWLIETRAFIQRGAKLKQRFYCSRINAFMSKRYNGNDGDGKSEGKDNTQVRDYKIPLVLPRHDVLARHEITSNTSGENSSSSVTVQLIEGLEARAESLLRTTEKTRLEEFTASSIIKLPREDRPWVEGRVNSTSQGVRRVDLDELNDSGDGSGSRLQKGKIKRRPGTAAI